MSDCIFCKIINNELPSHKLLENDFVLGFLDINPATEGHCLVVPKQHNKNFSELDEVYVKEMSAAGQKIMNKIKSSKIKCEGFNLLLNENEVAGQDVMHAHLHIIPRIKSDQQKLQFFINEKAQKRLADTCTEINRP